MFRMKVAGKGAIDPLGDDLWFCLHYIQLMMLDMVLRRNRAGIQV
jgi:hypothetical protein